MFLEADLHVHTIASGHAYSTLTEVAREATKKGLKLIAVTEHGPSMPGAPQPLYFGNMWVVPRQVEGVCILRGIEANILPGGELDLPERYLARLDLVLAGFHRECISSGSVAENTQVMIKAMENPYVDMVSHPGNPAFQVDPEMIVRAAKEHGVIIEINNNSFQVRKGSIDNCRAIAKWAARLGVKVAVNSDSHFATHVGEVADALALIKEAGVPQELILNAEADRVKKFLRERGKPLGKHTKALV
ncbi:MAG: phosphatase [bacterium]